MSQAIQGELYSFRPVDRVRWQADSSGQLEGMVHFWTQEAGSEEQPHSWVQVRLLAKDRPRSVLAVKVIRMDPDYPGPLDAHTLGQAAKAYVGALFEASGWEGVLYSGAFRSLTARPATIPPQPLTFAGRVMPRMKAS